jgi:predicted porin
MEIYRMKKSLFAVAAMSAVAGVAQAQSSVTVYGILDVGYQGSNLTQSTVSTTTGNTLLKTNTNAFAASGEQTSRLGFKGTEDLGGGSSAFFTVELGLQPMYGNLSGSSSTNDVQQGNTNGSGSAIDNRQAFAGLKKNGLGQFALGRQYTPIFNAGAATSPGQYNNIQGDVIYVGSTNGTAGQTQNSGFTNRGDSALTFQTDSFAGARIAGMYAMQNSNSTIGSGGFTNANSTQGGGNTNWNGWGLSADYTWNKLYLVAAAQQFNEKYDNAIWASTGTVLNLNGTNPNGGQVTATGTVLANTNIKDRQTFLGGTYDFGILKAYVQYVNRTVTQGSSVFGAATTFGNSAVNAGAPTLQRSAQQIGVRSYVTPTIEAWASAGNGRYRGANTAITTSSIGALGTQGPATRFTAYQLGANYYLSKRTNLYGIFGAYVSSGNGQGNASATSGAGNSNQYAVGIRHTF